MAATVRLGDNIYWSDFELFFILSFHGFEMHIVLKIMI